MTNKSVGGERLVDFGYKRTPANPNGRPGRCQAGPGDRGGMTRPAVLCLPYKYFAWIRPALSRFVAAYHSNVSKCPTSSPDTIASQYLRHGLCSQAPKNKHHHISVIKALSNAKPRQCSPRRHVPRDETL